MCFINFLKLLYVLHTGKYIDESALSSDYGGTAQIRFDVDSYLSADTYLQKRR
jgi:hypothetical protein